MSTNYRPDGTPKRAYGGQTPKIATGFNPDAAKRLQAAAMCTTDEARIDFIYEEISLGTWGIGDTARMGVQWKMKPAKVQHYLVRPAMAKFSKTVDPEERRARMVSQVDYLIARVLETQHKWGIDYKTALEGIRIQAQLLGLFTHKHEISGPGGSPIQAQVARFTNEEIDSKILEYADKVKMIRDSGQPLTLRDRLKAEAKALPEAIDTTGEPAPEEPK